MNAPVAEPAPVPRRRHGCLWGCLAVLVIISLPGLITGWFFWRGYHDDPALKAATELVRKDGIARLVLGDDIHVTGVVSRDFAYSVGQYSERAYTVELAGSRAGGTLNIRVHRGREGMRFDGLELTGPDGRRYDLMHHGVLPATPGRIEDSI